MISFTFFTNGMQSGPFTVTSNKNPVPCTDLKCCESPKHTNSPAFITPIRVHTLSHSNILCVVNTIAVVFVLAILDNNLHINLEATGSRPGKQWVDNLTMQLLVTLFFCFLLINVKLVYSHIS